MDDNEVYNNKEHGALFKSGEADPEVWRKDHLGMDLPTRCISIDISVENDEGKKRMPTGSDRKASMVGPRRKTRCWNGCMKWLRCLNLSGVLYQRVIIDEESLTAIAEEEGAPGGYSQPDYKIKNLFRKFEGDLKGRFFVA